MTLSVDSTIKELLADERARAMFDKHMPGFSTHPALGMVMGMSLRTIAQFPQAQAAGLTEERLQAIDAALRGLG